MPRTVTLTPGDVFEIKLNQANSFGYLQYIYSHEMFGQCMRVLSGTYVNRPELNELANKTEITIVFFPLKYALKDKDAVKIGNIDLPKNTDIPPRMRVRGLMKEDGSYSWSIWNGKRAEGKRMQGELTPDQKKIPVLGTANINAVREMIEGKWIFD